MWPVHFVKSFPEVNKAYIEGTCVVAWSMSTLTMDGVLQDEQCCACAVVFPEATLCYGSELQVLTVCIKAVVKYIGVQLIHG